MDSKNYFNPYGAATREEVVNILERLCDEGAFFKATMPRSGLVYAMNN